MYVDVCNRHVTVVYLSRAGILLACGSWGRAMDLTVATKAVAGPPALGAARELGLMRAAA